MLGLGCHSEAAEKSQSTLLRHRSPESAEHLTENMVELSWGPRLLVTQILLTWFILQKNQSDNIITGK